MKKIIGIYKITSPTKKVYIGQAVDIKYRFCRYRGMGCKTQPRLYNSLKKHGVHKHKFEILVECEIDKLNELERYYQDLYSCIGDNGLNCTLTKASDRKYQHSKETILKLKNITEENRRGIIERMRRRIVTPETRLKRSIRLKGKPSIMKGKRHSEETKRKLIDFNSKLVINLETGIFYDSTKQAALYNNIKLGTLSKKMCGIRPNKTSLRYA